MKLFSGLRRYGSPHRQREAQGLTIVWLTIATLVAIAPHLGRMHWSISIIGVGAIIWRLGIQYRQWPLPNLALRVLLVAAGVAVVLLEYGAIYGKIAGSSLLAVALCLKLLETRSVRDVEFTVFLTYFVIITNFFFDQSIPTALLMAVAVAIVTSTLISAHDVKRPQMDRSKFRVVGQLMLQGLPLMLVLFVFFPRASGPLWAWPRDEVQGISGLSDTMSPGSISQMILSEEVAFRVDFKEAIPDESELYWRALVFGRFDGRTWSSLEHETAAQRHWLALPEDPMEYTITMEPTNERWMFALEMPDTLLLPERTRLTADFRLTSRKKVNQRLRYSLTSYRRYLVQSQPDDLPDFVRHQNLRLPEGFAPQARELAARWRRQSDSDAAVVRRALLHFRERPFSYTLIPERLGPDAVDDFLFRTQEGYCEHFSSSFTVLMRAAGIPARVVTGYQGGEINPVGNYMIVPQANAHAWSEVWLEGEGWVRVDPTAAVAPDRVNEGVASALGEEVQLPDILSRSDDSWLRQMRFVWDAVNNGWNQFVLGYGIKHQYRLLDWLGINNANRGWLLAVMLGALTVVLGLIAIWVILHRPKPPHPALRLYRRFLRQMRRAGCPHESGEGPLAFQDRACEALPDKAEYIRRITGVFIRAYYGPQASDAALQELRKVIR